MNNILVITYWDFNDALIQTYTLPYLRIISKNLPPRSSIWLLTLDKKNVTDAQKEALRLDLFAEGIVWISYSYRRFGLVAMLRWIGIAIRLVYLIIKNNIRAVHCWATPAGAIGYFLSIITGRKLIVDSYEPHAESMVENGTWKRDSIAFRLLFWLEKKQSRRAYSLIAATDGMREYAKAKYGVISERFFVKPACVDLQLFSFGNIKNTALLNELKLTDKIVCVYAGKLGGIYLERETFDFFKVAYDYWSHKFRIVLLSSHTREEVDYYCREAGLDSSIITLKFVPHSMVPDYLGLGDFAITPVKPVPTKRYCTPIKNGEYWALGLPVVITQNISDDSDIIQANNAGAILMGFEKNDYHLAVRKIDELLQENSSELFSRINGLAHRYRSFDIAEEVYRNVYGKGF